MTDSVSKESLYKSLLKGYSSQNRIEVAWKNGVLGRKYFINKVKVKVLNCRNIQSDKLITDIWTLRQSEISNVHISLSWSRVVLVSKVWPVEIKLDCLPNFRYHIVSIVQQIWIGIRVHYILTALEQFETDQF